MTSQDLIRSIDMTRRFQLHRWSKTRTAIHEMAVGGSIHFHNEQYFNVHASVQRLNDAYAGERQWIMTCVDRAATVTRIK